MGKTKEEIIAQVKKNTGAIWSLNNKTEDINAIWHWCKCLEEQVNKQKEEISKLYEEMRQMQQDSKSNTE